MKSWGNKAGRDVVDWRKCPETNKKERCTSLMFIYLFFIYFIYLLIYLHVLYTCQFCLFPNCTLTPPLLLYYLFFNFSFPFQSLFHNSFCVLSFLEPLFHPLILNVSLLISSWIRKRTVQEVDRVRKGREDNCTVDDVSWRDLLQKVKKPRISTRCLIQRSDVFLLAQL